MRSEAAERAAASPAAALEVLVATTRNAYNDLPAAARLAMRDDWAARCNDAERVMRSVLAELDEAAAGGGTA